VSGATERGRQRTSKAGRERDHYRQAKRRTVVETLPYLLGPEAEPFGFSVDGPDGPVAHPQLVQVSNNPCTLSSIIGFGSRARLGTGVLGGCPVRRSADRAVLAPSGRVVPGTDVVGPAKVFDADRPKTIFADAGYEGPTGRSSWLRTSTRPGTASSSAGAKAPTCTATACFSSGSSSVPGRAGPRRPARGTCRPLPGRAARAARAWPAREGGGLWGTTLRGAFLCAHRCWASWPPDHAAKPRRSARR
jgi:hypothetical protein